METPKGVADIGQAVRWMKEGRRVCRAGWNGKGMWLSHVEGRDWGCAFANHPMDGTEGGTITQPSLPFIVMRTAPGPLVPWLCSQTDLLATDWEVV